MSFETKYAILGTEVTDMVQRLDKLVASQGSWSRSDAQRCIRSGAVTVDGSVCRDPSAKVDPDGRQITVAGRL